MTRDENADWRAVDHDLLSSDDDGSEAMAAEIKTIIVQPGSELAEVRDEATEGPVRLVKNGRRFRLVQEESDLFANYDPDRVRAALRRSFGVLRGVDIDELLRDLKDQREQDSSGRPDDW
jgi:hypothetical protein